MENSIYKLLNNSPKYTLYMHTHTSYKYIYIYIYIYISFNLYKIE